jgi:hypothetical protein
MMRYFTLDSGNQEKQRLRKCLPQQNVLIEAEVKTQVKMKLTRYWKSLSDATFPSPTFATNRRSRSVRTANIISSRRASRANPFCRLRV